MATPQQSTAEAVSPVLNSQATPVNIANIASSRVLGQIKVSLSQGMVDEAEG